MPNYVNLLMEQVMQVHQSSKLLLPGVHIQLNIDGERILLVLVTLVLLFLVILRLERLVILRLIAS